MDFPKSLSIPIYTTDSSTGFGFNAPKLVVERQPRKRGYRFRYASEGKTHGMLPGELDPDCKENSSKKFFPTIKLENHRGPAKVVMMLVTSKEPFQMHAHTLLVDKIAVKGYHVFDIKEGHFKIELKNIAIQHAVKEHLPHTLKDRILQSEFVKDSTNNSYRQYRVGGGSSINIEQFVQGVKDLPNDTSEITYSDRISKIEIKGDMLQNLKDRSAKLGKTMNMSTCRLCFITFLKDNSGQFTHMLEPVYSDEIIDGKKKEGAPLKIIRTSHVAGSVEGGKEIWLLSDKIDAEDTEVYFWEKKDSKDEFLWEGYGEFNKTDVYKQALIVFKTPMYYDQNIDQPRSVNMQLRRKKDKNCVSDIHQFMFKPKHYDRYGLREKRRKQIPAELYHPPTKRPALSVSPSGESVIRHINGDGFTNHRSSPANPAEDGENPSISDYLFQALKGGPSSNNASPLPSLNLPSWPHAQMNQILANYANPTTAHTHTHNESGDESRGS